MLRSLSIPLVLGSARIGLILTRSQERTQPGPLTQTGQTNGIFHTMCCPARFRVGELAGGKGVLARELGNSLGIRQWGLLHAFCCLFCIFFLSVLLLLFVSFAVLLNFSYPDSRVFAFFFPFSSPPQRGEGAIERWRGPLLSARAKLRYLYTQKDTEIQKIDFELQRPDGHTNFCVSEGSDHKQRGGSTAKQGGKTNASINFSALPGQMISNQGKAGNKTFLQLLKTWLTKVNQRKLLVNFKC